MATSSRECIGPYRRLNVIRTTKASEIVEVLHDAKGQRLAIKLLQPAYVHDKSEIALLKHEYAVGRTLKHPSIIRIDQCHCNHDLAYMVMEYFPAPNLKQIIQRGAQRIAHLTMPILRQATESLGYLHQQGWIHRDVKPDNFLVSDEGELKLIDFALAQRPKGSLARLLGGRGKIQGTRSYMSPEQIQGGAIDVRADIYSLGCVIHELLSGKPPFTAASSSELLNKHLKLPPPSLLTSDANLTKPFAQLVLRMLEKKADQRPGSMAELLLALDGVRVYHNPPRPPADNN